MRRKTYGGRARVIRLEHAGVGIEWCDSSMETMAEGQRCMEVLSRIVGHRRMMAGCYGQWYTKWFVWCDRREWRPTEGVDQIRTNKREGNGLVG